MKFTQATVVAFLAATAVAGNVPKRTTTDCEKLRSDCESQPNANQSDCAAKHAACARTTSDMNKSYPSATGNPHATTATTTVTGYVTYCPESTTFEVNQKTYTATESQWVTVTDCPESCTIIYQPNATPTIYPGTIVPVWNGSVTTTAPSPAGNGTYNKLTATPSSGFNSSNNGAGSGTTGSGPGFNSGNGGSGSGSSGSGSSGPAEFTGAANKFACSYVALVTLIGAFAYLL